VVGGALFVDELTWVLVITYLVTQLGYGRKPGSVLLRCRCARAIAIREFGLTTVLTMKETTASTLALEKKMQQTVAKAFTQSGVGLHTGSPSAVLLPAAAGTGRYFVRVDMHSQPIIPARVEAVSQTVLSTQLGGEGLCGTVEHLLAALAMMV